MTKNVVYILIGVPGCGKSTWVNNQEWIDESYDIISVDSYILEHAMQSKLYYHEVKDRFYKSAKRLAILQTEISKLWGRNIIIDANNISINERKQYLHLLKDYHKVAVFFNFSDIDILHDRNKKQCKETPGKVHSKRELYQSIHNIVIPTVEEGFDEIWYG